MKTKRIVLCLCAVLAVSMLSACGGKDTNGKLNQDNDVADVQGDKEDTGASEDSEQEPAYEGIVAVPENFTYREENGELTITGYEGEVNTLLIPESIDGKPVTKIGEDSFKEHLSDGITKLVIPDSVTVIESGAFIAAKLKEIDFGNGLKEIGASAFWRSTIEYVTFPDSLERIGAWSFCYTGLKEVTIPPSVTVIEDSAFAVTKLETITIPGHIKVIEESAFESCRELKTVVIEEGVEAIGENAFRDCWGMESITFPASATEIHEYAISGCGQDVDAVNIYVPEGSVAAEVLSKYCERFERFKVIVQ